MATPLDPTAGASAAAVTSTPIAGTSAAARAANEAASADRFLRLLVTQMKNQDPLNPLDNAEVTSQMAQISTVQGIEKLNANIAKISDGFARMQIMQGAALVGRDVLLEGNRMRVDDKGEAGGGFEIDGAADNVRIEILSGAGALIDAVDLGAQDAGRHSFDWTPRAGIDPATVGSFRVTARSGAQPLPVIPLMRDRIESVITGGPQLTLELESSGNTPYGNVKAFN